MRAPLAALALAVVAHAAPTHVVGTLHNTNGAAPSGYVLLTSPTVIGGDATIHPGATTQLTITAGRFDAWLEPALYVLGWGNLGDAERRNLTVPTSSAAVDLAACLTTPPADPLAPWTLTPATITPTRVTGTLRDAAQTPANGYIVLTWQTFTGADSIIYPGGSARVPIAGCRFDARLAPGSYSLAWGNIGAPEFRTLSVPPSTTAVDLAACLTTTPAEPLMQFALQQLSPSGAHIGQALTYTANGWAPADVVATSIPISEIPGLQAALSALASNAELTAEIAARQADTAADTTNAAAIASEATARAAAIAAAAPRTYTESFTSALTVTIPASAHQFSTAELSVVCRDPAGYIYDAAVSVNPTTYLVTIEHAEPQTGYCTVRR